MFWKDDTVHTGLTSDITSKLPTRIYWSKHYLSSPLDGLTNEVCFSICSYTWGRKSQLWHLHSMSIWESWARFTDIPRTQEICPDFEYIMALAYQIVNSATIPSELDVPQCYSNTTMRGLIALFKIRGQWRPIVPYGRHTAYHHQSASDVDRYSGPTWTNGGWKVLTPCMYF